MAKSKAKKMRDHIARNHSTKMRPEEKRIDWGNIKAYGSKTPTKREKLNKEDRKIKHNFKKDLEDRSYA